jgi:concanavalin A-like lectin/glucanase superfamily protein
VSWDFTGAAGMGKPNATLALNAFSFACWLKRTAAQSFTALQHCIVNGESTRFTTQIWDGPNNFNFRIRDASAVDAELIGTATAAIDTWSFVCVRYSGGLSGTQRLRVNSTDDAPNTAGLSSGFPMGSTVHLGFAGLFTTDASSFSKSYVGKLAHMAYWNISLSDADVSALVSGGSGGKGANPETVQFANLKAYWYDSKTDRIAGITLVDQNGTMPAYDADEPTVDAPGGGAVYVPRRAMMGYGD